MRPERMFSELSPRPGVNPAWSNVPVVEHLRLERHAQELAQLADHPFRRSGQLLVPDGETGQRHARLLDHGHVPQPLGHGLLQAPGFLAAATPGRTRSAARPPPRPGDAAGRRTCASGQAAAMRSQTSTLLGVLTTRRGLPLRRSASASTRSQSMCSTSSTVSSSPSSEAWIHFVSARTPRCLSGSSGGAYSSRVAAQDGPEQRRAGPGRGKDEHRRGQQPPAVCLRQVPRPAREGTGQLIPGDSHQHRVEQLWWRNPPGPVRQRAGELISDGALEYRVDPLLAVHT